MKSHEVMGQLLKIDGNTELGIIVGEISKDGVATISWDFELVKLEGQKLSVVLVPLRYANRRFSVEKKSDGSRHPDSGPTAKK